MYVPIHCSAVTPSHILRPMLDANTVGSIASIASIDWGCAVQIMAAVTIGSKDQSFSPTNAQLLCVFNVLSCPFCDLMQFLQRYLCLYYHYTCRSVLSWH